MTDQRLEAQLQNLIGKTANNQTNLVNQDLKFTTQILGMTAKFLAMLPLVETAHIETLERDVLLHTESPILHVYDTNGGERTVRLPDPSSKSRFFVIINSGT